MTIVMLGELSWALFSKRVYFINKFKTIYGHRNEDAQSFRFTHEYFIMLGMLIFIRFEVGICFATAIHNSRHTVNEIILKLSLFFYFSMICDNI